MALIEPSLVKEIASQLQKPVSYVFETIAKAQPVTGLINLVAILGFGIGGWIIIKKWHAWISEQDIANGDYEAALILGGGLLIGFWVLFVLTVHGALVKLWLPEYSAVKEIANMIILAR